jgi:hypothetical protein
MNASPAVAQGLTCVVTKVCRREATKQVALDISVIAL